MLHAQAGKRFVRLPLGLFAAQAVVHRAEEHIVQHRRHEHLVIRVLQDIAQLPAHGGQILPRDGKTVHGDAARIRHEAERGLHQRGLSRAVRADQSGLFTVLNGKRKLAQHLRSAIKHADVIEYQHKRLLSQTNNPPSSADRSKYRASSISAGHKSAYGHDAAEPRPCAALGNSPQKPRSSMLS